MSGLAWSPDGKSIGIWYEEGEDIVDKWLPSLSSCLLLLPLLEILLSNLGKKNMECLLLSNITLPDPISVSSLAD